MMLVSIFFIAGKDPHTLFFLNDAPNWEGDQDHNQVKMEQVIASKKKLDQFCNLRHLAKIDQKK